MRNAKEPNKRIQDGYKCKMLCKECETAISIYEKSFKNSVFDNIYKYTDSGSIKYDSNLLKFCVSLSWRTITYLDITNGLSHLPKNIMQHVNIAMTTWSDFLLNKKVHPEKYKQYIIIFDGIINSTGKLPNNINHYIFSSCDLDLCYSESDVFVYIKIFKMLIISPIYIDKKEYFKAENIHVRGGVINKVFDIKFPAQWWDYLCKKSLVAFNSQLSISDRQLQIISEYTLSNKDKFLGSEALKGYKLDHDLSYGNSDDVTPDFHEE